jgi:hypothetical protein
MSAHFEKWVDTKIPALDGLTPTGKEKVAALVLEVQRHARKMEPRVDEAVLARLEGQAGPGRAAARWLVATPN